MNYLYGRQMNFIDTFIAKPLNRCAQEYRSPQFLGYPGGSWGSRNYQAGWLPLFSMWCKDKVLFSLRSMF